MSHAKGLRWAAVLFIGLATTATASPIRYTTEGETGPHLHFEGTSGTFEPGSTISLGKFVIDAPAPGSETTLDHQAFSIVLKAPDFDEPRPAGTAASYPTTRESSLLIQGQLSGVLRGDAPGLVATFDTVKLGGIGPYLQGHVQEFTFPVPVADVKVPAQQILLIPTDGWDGSSPHAVEVLARVVPEPASWAVCGLIALAGLRARGLAARSEG